MLQVSCILSGWQSSNLQNSSFRFFPLRWGSGSVVSDSEFHGVSFEDHWGSEAGKTEGMNRNESGVSLFQSLFQNCMHGVNLIFIYSKFIKWLIFFLDVATCKVSLTQIKMTLEISLKYFFNGIVVKKNIRLLSAGKCLVLKRQTKCTVRFNAILSTDLALYPVMIMFLSFCF